jgi:20S proteasome subunit beta 3
MEYKGGSVVAMIGKDCVAIASDLRLGQQAVGVAANFDKVSLPPPARCSENHNARPDIQQVFPVNDRLFYGLPGLASDTYTL